MASRASLVQHATSRSTFAEPSGAAMQWCSVACAYTLHIGDTRCGNGSALRGSGSAIRSASDAQRTSTTTSTRRGPVTPPIAARGAHREVRAPGRAHPRASSHRWWRRQRPGGRNARRYEALLPASPPGPSSGSLQTPDHLRSHWKHPASPVPPTVGPSLYQEVNRPGAVVTTNTTRLAAQAALRLPP